MYFRTPDRLAGRSAPAGRRLSLRRPKRASAPEQSATEQPDKRIGCIVLTQGKRPDELKRAIDSLLSQRDVELDVVVVNNGGEPIEEPDGVRMLPVPENLGIPGGRNVGIDHVEGDLILFLDDDAYLCGDDFAARAAAMFADRKLGVVQPRVLDPEGKRSPRRYVPRLRVGDDRRASNVAALWEGTVVVRRDALEKAGRWPTPLFYMHEGIELAWRVIDAGYRVRYAGDQLETYHPAVDRETRHADLYYMGARNRVWLARRNLPLPWAAVYLATWLILDFTRVRGVRNAREQLRGYRDGFGLPCGRRSPIRMSAAWRMARAGRPPII